MPRGVGVVGGTGVAYEEILVCVSAPVDGLLLSLDEIYALHISGWGQLHRNSRKNIPGTISVSSVFSLVLFLAETPK